MKSVFGDDSDEELIIEDVEKPKKSKKNKNKSEKKSASLKKELDMLQAESDRLQHRKERNEQLMKQPVQVVDPLLETMKSNQSLYDEDDSGKCNCVGLELYS